MFAGRAAQIAREKIADKARDSRVAQELAAVLHAAAASRWEQLRAAVGRLREPTENERGAEPGHGDEHKRPLNIPLRA
jgi:hypothetical protein